MISAIIKNVQLLVIAMFLMICNKLNAQTNYLDLPVNLKSDSLTIEQHFNNLAKQCKCYFTYDARLVNESRKIAIEIPASPLSKVLDTLLNNPEFHYQVVGNQIVIQPVSPSVSQIDSAIAPNNFIELSGIIIDNSSHQALPFATVSIKGKNLGAVANQNGEFRFKIPDECKTDTFTFSFVGYFLKETTVNCFPEDGKIRLIPCFVPIQEIIVRSNSPVGIVQKAIDKVSQNYYSGDYNYKAFYRESVKKDNQVKVYSEALLSGYKPYLLNNTAIDKVELLKGRKFSNYSKSDTISVKLKAGIETCFRLDLIHQPTDFLTTEGMNQYNYHLDDITLLNNSLVYIIGFSPKQTAEGMFEGDLYIDISSYAIVRVEFKFVQQKFSKAQNLFVMRKSRQISIKPMDSYYTVNYKKLNGKYYADHVRGEFSFKVKKRRQLLNEKYCTNLEMAISNFDTVEVKKPTIRNLLTISSILSENQLIYDEKFWNEQNIILPEESIKQAIAKWGFKLELQEE